MKKTLYCKQCKVDGMVDLINKKCITCDLKHASFNYSNEKQALYCNDCKTCGMVDVENKKCIVCNIKQPVFNYPHEKNIIL